MISERYVIGVDDTGEDDEATAALMARFAARIEADGFAQSLGVTEHQLWESPKVPATGWNRCYAIAISTERQVFDVEDLAVDFVRAESTETSDPGVAVLTRHADMPHALAFGRRAKQELLELRDAERYATESNVLLRGLGAKRLGMVGALAAAGLRAGGKDGHYVALRGLVELEGRVTAGQVRERTPIEHVLDGDGAELDRDDVIDTRGRLVPRVEGGEPVLRVAASREERRLWVPVDRRR